jgi:hypothetical protein
VTRQIKTEGRFKLSQISNSTIRVYAKQYLAVHPELFAQAEASRIVSRGPVDPTEKTLIETYVQNGGSK